MSSADVAMTFTISSRRSRFSVELDDGASGIFHRTRKSCHYTAAMASFAKDVAFLTRYDLFTFAFLCFYDSSGFFRVRAGFSGVAAIFSAPPAA